MLQMEHERDTDTSIAVRHILGMPIGTISAIATLIVLLFTVWLTHDRLIAAVTTKAEHNDQRITTLEEDKKERQKRDLELEHTLGRIEQKLDDVKEHFNKEDRNVPIH